MLLLPEPESIFLLFAFAEMKCKLPISVLFVKCFATAEQPG